MSPWEPVQKKRKIKVTVTGSEVRLEVITMVTMSVVPLPLCQPEAAELEVVEDQTALQDTHADWSDMQTDRQTGQTHTQTDRQTRENRRPEEKTRGVYSQQVPGEVSWTSLHRLPW